MKEWQKWVSAVVLVSIVVGVIAIFVYFPYSIFVAAFVVAVVGVKKKVFP